MQEQSSFDALPARSRSHAPISISCHFHSPHKRHASSLPKFTTTPSKVAKALRSRCGLLHLIIRERLNTALGTYIPQSDNLYLTGKKPDLNASAQPAYFSNALLLPHGFDQGHLDWTKFPPSQRLTILACCLSLMSMIAPVLTSLMRFSRGMRGENGQFIKSRFAAVDRELLRHRDYQGYSIVYSGRRSFQFHFIFSPETS